MDVTDPEVWRWLWLIAAIVFAVGEIAIAGSFFLAPFAVGATVATLMAFLGVPVPIQWIGFVGVSGACFLALRPLARRLDVGGPTLGVGAHRQVGQAGRVIEDIDPSMDRGFVMLGSERWRAESTDGRPLPAGTPVTVVEVRGTRLLVAAGDHTDPPQPALPESPEFDPRPPAGDA